MAKKDNSAFKQAQQDIREDLARQGKTYIHTSLRQLKLFNLYCF